MFHCWKDKYKDGSGYLSKENMGYTTELFKGIEMVTEMQQGCEDALPLRNKQGANKRPCPPPNWLSENDDKKNKKKNKRWSFLMAELTKQKQQLLFSTTIGDNDQWWQLYGFIDMFAGKLPAHKPFLMYVPMYTQIKPQAD